MGADTGPVPQAAFTAALEAGAQTFVFDESETSIREEWQSLGSFKALIARGDGALFDGEAEIGRVVRVGSPDELRAAEALVDFDGAVIMDASDWTVIPAENLVAAFQGGRASLIGVAARASDARTLLGALEVGTDGVLLRTDSPVEVRAAFEYAQEALRQSGERLQLVTATVTSIKPVGMGDRVAVDLCSLLVPGEGLLVGSFSRGLFLVHSECNESRYINSRPFRVNCGPVHAYVAMPNGRTAYLSELASGTEALVVDPSGRQRTAIVGRTKIETRPLMLLDGEVEGERFSTLLQNAETVRLVTPGGPESAWSSKAVTELRAGDALLLYRTDAARHTGMAIKENIVER